MDDEYSKFAKAVIGENPCDALAKIYGLARKLNETDTLLYARIEAVKHAR